MSDKTRQTVKVFGSAVLRVEPDVASLNFAVSREAKEPKDAFAAAHKAVKAVRGFLALQAAGDVAASHVTLARTSEYLNGRHVPTGYAAKVSFNLLLADLDRMEELLVGVVGAVPNEIGSVEFRASRLREYRAEARRRAVGAAREKAEVYCAAAGVSLGDVVSLEDVNPDSLRGSGEGHTSREAPAEEGAERAFSPGSITVGAAVWVVFALGKAGARPEG